jgi:acetoin utilization protein AcuB
MQVKDYMRAPVISISPEAGLDRALVIMRTQRIRHLPVVDKHVLVGLITSRDLKLSMVEEAGPDHAPKGLYLPALTKINDIMKKDLLTASPTDPLDRAARVMSERKIGCLPVIEEKTRHLVGIITESDLLRLLVTLLGKAPMSGAHG